MLSEDDFRPRAALSGPELDPAQWLSAEAARTAVLAVPGRAWGRQVTIATRAAEGYLHAWAESYRVGETRWGGCEIPAAFWVEQGGGDQDSWILGNFSTVARGGFALEARGVRFYLPELAMVFPNAFRRRNAVNTPPTSSAKTKSKGGRKMSASWPQWVAELVAYVHEQGFPPGQGSDGTDVVINAVADQLAHKGLEGLSRSTVQETVRAVLLRSREPPARKR